MTGIRLVIGGTQQIRLWTVVSFLATYSLSYPVLVLVPPLSSFQFI